MICSPKLDENELEDFASLSPSGKDKSDAEIALHGGADRLRTPAGRRGTPATELCRKLGSASRPSNTWKKRFAGMGVGELKRARQLEEENRWLSRRPA